MVIYYSCVSNQTRSFLLSLISAEEQITCANFKNQQAQQTYLVSRALMRSCLSKVSGVRPLDLVFDLTEHKKPFLKTTLLFILTSVIVRISWCWLFQKLAQ